MTKFTVKECPIEGPLIIKPAVLGESRDYLFNLDEQDIYEQMELECTFEQHFSETLARGVMRGLYFQRKESYGRIIAVTQGSALCVAIDMRPESKNFGAAHSIYLDGESETMLFIPPYFAHGYLTLERDTQVVINSQESYDPSAVSGIIWDDEILSINWQFERYDIDSKRLNILPRDKKFPSFRSYPQNSIWIDRPKKSRYALASSIRAPKVQPL